MNPFKGCVSEWSFLKCLKNEFRSQKRTKATMCLIMLMYFLSNRDSMSQNSNIVFQKSLKLKNRDKITCKSNLLYHFYKAHEKKSLQLLLKLQTIIDRIIIMVNRIESVFIDTIFLSGNYSKKVNYIFCFEQRQHVII